MPIRGALLAFALSMGLVGCVTTSERAPAPAPEQSTGLSLLGLPNARFHIDSDPDAFAAEARRAHMAQRAATGLARLPTQHLLALSGGGEHGAFGAGILYGWSERGDRPVFDVVTGVSTGALMAPFAFLGRRYDGALREVYTTIDKSHVFNVRPILAAVTGDALADATPLEQLITRFLTDAMVAEIGAEYRRGRLLFVGTTNLDRAQPVVWNVGAIAASGHPEAPRLIRRILLASASIPGAFPPVMFDVEVGGRRMSELHVDGGTTAQAFLYPANIPLRNAPREFRERRRIAYVIRNGRPLERPEETRRALVPIATRSISTMIAANGIGDMYRLFAVTRRDGVDFNLAYITRRFAETPSEPFDRAFMNRLFEHGREQARTNVPWAKHPPGYRP